MKIGIISFAHMHAYSYAQALKNIDGVELAGIADDNEQRGRQYAEHFGTMYVGNYEDLLKLDIDAVIVTSENSHHREHVVAAAKAGKHVLCEKPLATTAQDGQEMIDACLENGVLLQTAFPVRFHPAVIRAKQLIDEGKIGRVLAMKGTNHGQNPGGWFIDPAFSGGGAVLDHTVHVVDLMRWFMNTEVKEVYAEIGNLISETPIDDCGILSLEFENGVYATLDCSWSRNKAFPTWGDVTLEIVGTEGNISIDAFNQKLHLYSNEQGYKHKYWGDDMDQGLIADFVASVRDGKKEAFITGEDGLRAVEVAIAAYHSAQVCAPVAIRSTKEAVGTC
ncbi:Gfo/Idh/MocA family oxidoreductase [Paenibacillus frigoriresistens]|uniref:Gfo/Idh/MocA family protein n=1 Tax=Paenibacillus alginolyticus TaxID=59839 RepID=UPI001564494F|nr:Gfo/Idh/MocA family oxidoreductase [Paenibacillus frigoriresistens]NRF95726.1 Gfo/Idh/MocA family oxidoreductase [Paenibacillus frigoriresistens]